MVELTRFAGKDVFTEGEGFWMSGARGFVVLPLSDGLVKDVNKTNEEFELFGRVVPRFESGEWSFEEELFGEPRVICFPDDRLDWAKYMGHEDRALFLAYRGDECVGQVRVVREWNRFCYVENVAIRQAFRGLGVGRLLMEKAEEWARDRGLIGLSLEAQDDNLGACRFYVRQGFVLGGVDTLKQSYTPNIGTTLYWYKLFGS